MSQLNIKKSISAEDDKGRLITVGYGPVRTPGKDLPSGCNIAKYLDASGLFDPLRFFRDHKGTFPNLFIIVQREVSRRVTEVGCERFFGLSGYVSQPRRARLGVRNYERISMLANILRNVYVDPKWVAAEYLRRSKNGAWKKENIVESMKCFNLERILEAEIFGQKCPDDMNLQEYMESLEDM